MTAITRVPLLDLTRLEPEVVTGLREAFERVLTSGRYVMGPEVEGLEDECARFLGVEHAIGVSSGTDALILALMSLGIGSGDEVICPTYSFFATAGAIWRVGARPVFVDIDPATYDCDPRGIEDVLTKRTKAVIPVHLFGQCADMNPILELAGRRGIPVVEDAAQAMSATLDDRQAGSMGDIGCFSFFPSKNLGCLGDGGLVTTDNAELAGRARVMRVHGGERKYHHAVVGGNFRLDALQAAFLRVKLAGLNDASSRRRRNAELYSRLFTEAGVATEPSSEGPVPPGTLTLPIRARGTHIFNQFVVRVHGAGARDGLKAALDEQEIGNEIYYPVPLHLQECFGSLCYQDGDFPHAESAAQETLALPIFPELRPQEIAHVVDRVVAWCRAGHRPGAGA